MLCRWILILGLGFVVAVFSCFVTAEESWASHVLAQAAGGTYIGTDERSGDSVIRVGPSGESKPGTRMYMDRNPGPGDALGDRVIHVVPPPEEKQETEVLFGPLLITPEITWPGNTKPGMTRPDMTKPDMTKPDMTKPDMTKPDMTKPDMTKPDPRVPHDRMPREQTAPGKRD
ncbi:hypothetical protein [Desulfonatronum sp. SC1]|uniref:hypothetical protein n=1 Tax=Desulfonatronum sp. SC1 TaxID=2109626 RepID=UPI001304ECEA|nr:hypothetical protein [Desulfonatronum sp. SC1]